MSNLIANLFFFLVFAAIGGGITYVGWRLLIDKPHQVHPKR